MYNPKVSIIVPVHNAGAYFKRCLDSITNQTLKDIEIILVLDSPTDGSDKIAEDFALKDNRIKLIYNEENLHTGLSRNKGMQIASGEYIGFHDHDDYSAPNMFELLYDRAKKSNADVARCNFYCVFTEKESLLTERYIYPDELINVTDKEAILSGVSGDKVSCVIWNHIYKSDFLKESKIQFEDSRRICSEDSIFFLEVYSKAIKLELIPDYLYFHVFHSANTGKVYGYRSIKNRVSFFEKIYILLQENGVSDDKCLLFMSENVFRSLYTGSRQAFLLLPFRDAIKEVRYIKRRPLMKKFIQQSFGRVSWNALRRTKLKPSIVVFFYLYQFLNRLHII